MYPIEVKYDGGARFIVRAGVHNLYSDQRKADGGEDWGPTPTELFVASLAACGAYYASRYLIRHEIPVDDLHVEADFSLSKTSPARVESITLKATVPAGLSEAQEHALRRVIEHCTVHNSLRIPPEVSMTVTSRSGWTKRSQADPGHTALPARAAGAETGDVRRRVAQNEGGTHATPHV